MSRVLVQSFLPLLRLHNCFCGWRAGETKQASEEGRFSERLGPERRYILMCPPENIVKLSLLYGYLQIVMANPEDGMQRNVFQFI
jgi:hypothetical protein